MPVLKRIKLPLYYMNKRGKHIQFSLIDTTLYVRPEQYDLVDAHVVGDVKKTKKTVATNKRMKYDIVIEFESSITKSQRKAVHEELRNSLEREKANRFFANIMNNTVTHSVEEYEPILKQIDTLRKHKDLYSFHFRKASKKDKDRIKIGFSPNRELSSSFINTELLESFLFEIAKVEISHIVDVKSIKAKYNK